MKPGQYLVADAGETECDLRFVGQRVVRHDPRGKVQAATAYADDWAMPGMLHRVLRSPSLTNHLKQVDTTRAIGKPGMAAVLTMKDAPRNTPDRLPAPGIFAKRRG